MTKSSLFDAAAVLLLAGATALIALAARARSGAFEDAPGASVELTHASVGYPARVADALPRLEALVAHGSMRDRSAPTCDGDRALDEVALIEHDIGAGGDETIAGPLAEGVASLRSCLACTEEPRGCGEAARAFARVERSLGLTSREP